MGDIEWIFDDEMELKRVCLKSNGYEAYCLFCMTGDECRLARELNRTYRDVLAMPLMKMAHRSHNGKRYDVLETVLPGYVFAFTPVGKNITALRTIEIHYRILGLENGSGTLTGDDRKYAAWTLELGGVLNVSSAIRIGGRVRITDGPLLRLEGYIKEYSKKNRNCRVSVTFMGREMSVWLPFDWVDVADK